MNLDQILPHVFVGSCPASTEDIDWMKHDCGISAVLNVQTDDDFRYWGIDWDQLEGHYRDADIVVRRVPVRDYDTADLERNLPASVEALDALLRCGHTVHVHCSAGVNRSPTIVIAYLHWVQQWQLQNALDHVQDCRTCDPSAEAIQLAIWEAN